MLALLIDIFRGRYPILLGPAKSAIEAEAEPEPKSRARNHKLENYLGEQAAILFALGCREGLDDQARMQLLTAADEYQHALRKLIEGDVEVTIRFFQSQKRHYLDILKDPNQTSHAHARAEQRFVEICNWITEIRRGSVTNA